MADILYFESEKKNINIISSNNSEHYVGKLKEEINKLPSNFVMIGQSYIVNINHIKTFNSDNIVMNNNVVLKISRKYKNDFNIKMIEYNKVKR